MSGAPHFGAKQADHLFSAKGQSRAHTLFYGSFRLFRARFPQIVPVKLAPLVKILDGQEGRPECLPLGAYTNMRDAPLTAVPTKLCEKRVPTKPCHSECSEITRAAIRLDPSALSLAVIPRYARNDKREGPLISNILVGEALRMTGCNWVPFPADFPLCIGPVFLNRSLDLH